MQKDLFDQEGARGAGSRQCDIEDLIEEKLNMQYTAKRTRHRREEVYNLVFEDGLKAQIVKTGDQWQKVVVIDSYSMCLVHAFFNTMDEVAEFCHDAEVKAQEWIKTHVEVI